jgi:hypothetical protein
MATNTNPRGECTPWCSPKHQRHCGGPRCCPHLHTTTTRDGRRKRRRIW